jgi:DNA-binding NtrC family response regulator/predicted hydrocarbon binding protein
MKEFINMKASDLKLQEIVSFTDGLLSLRGRRLVIHDIHAFAQLRKDLFNTLGKDAARKILTRFGYYWGQEDAAAMKRLFKWDDLTEWIRAGARMHALQGVTRSVIKKLDMDRGSGRFRMEIVWHDSGEAEEHAIEFGPVDYPVCWMLVGYMSGYVSFCMKQDIYFTEVKCRASGARTCMAVGKDRRSWGSELSNLLPNFQADDIQDKVLNLTRELKSKNSQLSRLKKRLDQLEHKNGIAFVEAGSDSFRRVIELAGRIAPFNSSVLITGETGTGKEVLARYIHRLSHRAEGPFLPINCGALPESLLESELFGHKAGAFTDAIRDRTGLFEQAHEGTVFLDEIGDISPAMQLKILRVLQEREIVRVGENIPRKIDVRVMAATNKDLELLIREGKFREDLLYRLRVIEINIPPLREREEDIIPLARFIVKKLSERLSIPDLRLDGKCMDTLQTYPWPGNVRELENALERAAILSHKGLILPDCLPLYILHPNSRVRSNPSVDTTLAEMEKSHINAVLESVQGNKSRAARILGISPSTLWRKLKELDA